MRENVDCVLVQELEAILDAAGFPQEADVAVSYVLSPEKFQTKGSGERIAGIPGAGEAIAWGPILLAFLVQLTTDFLTQAKAKAVEAAAQGVVDYLRNKFRLKPRETRGNKEETIGAIVTALVKAGWDAGKAGAVAEELWNAGNRASRRLTGLGRKQEQ